MTAPELLSALGKKIGIEDLEFAENGTCLLILADDLELSIEEVQGENAVYLYGDVATAPATNQAELYARLLAANHFGAETGDATFALNQDTQTVVLLKRISLQGLQETEFQNLVQEFANWLLSWKAELGGESPHSNAGEEEAVSAGSSGDFIRV